MLRATGSRDAPGMSRAPVLRRAAAPARADVLRAAPPPSVEVLVDRWNVSLVSADRALRAGARYLPGEELGERRARLAAERVCVVGLLRAYAVTRGVEPEVVRVG